MGEAVAGMLSWALWLTNAVQFTKQGSVRVTVTSTAGVSDRSHCDPISIAMDMYTFHPIFYPSPPFLTVYLFLMLLYFEPFVCNVTAIDFKGVHAFSNAFAGLFQGPIAC
jgi:hypothetical protein